jgi:hypothetical protein
MWKNPTVITKYCKKITKYLVAGDFEQKPFPEIRVEYRTKPTIQVVELYEKLRHQALSHEGSEQTALGSALFQGALDITQGIVSDRNWQAIWDLSMFGHVSTMELNSKTDDVRGTFCVFIAELVHLMIGTEESFLCGIRHNQPTWVSYGKFRPGIDGIPKLYRINMDLRYIDPNDLDILPTYAELLDSSYPAGPIFPVMDGYWDKIANLLEDAYYNQQFLTHPAGSLVRVAGIHGVDEAIIKAKRGVSDPNYLDFLGVFTVHGKKYICTLCGEDAMKRPDDNNFVNANMAHSDVLFFRWLLSLLYHDLVTAKDVMPGRERRLDNKAKAAAKLPEKIAEDLRWIYIPRKRKKETLEIRRPAVNPRSMSPHRVSGHKRRANMTDRQREAVRALEQESGIEILRWIPEGYTFVRPHIVPADGSASIMQLPRFIRTRIQEDIKSLLLNSDE